MLGYEEPILSEMRAILNPALSTEGVLRAAQEHRLVIAVNKKAKGEGPRASQFMKTVLRSFLRRSQLVARKKEKAKSGRVYVSSTPKGFWGPYKIYTDYLSFAWMAKMPNAVFFKDGVALHAGSESSYSDLGTTAPGGCIRLRLETSKMIREKIMDMGLGRQPRQNKIAQEDKGRNRITQNSVSVKSISRQTGKLVGPMVKAWDTVIIIY
jgi:hypothetical protein